MKHFYNLLKAQIDKLFIDAKNEDTIGEYTQLTVNSITNSTLSVSEQSSVLIGAVESLTTLRAQQIDDARNKLAELSMDYNRLAAFRSTATQLLT